MGPPTLEDFILSNEHDFNGRRMVKVSREKNLTLGEFKAIGELGIKYNFTYNFKTSCSKLLAGRHYVLGTTPYVLTASEFAS